MFWLVWILYSKSAGKKMQTLILAEPVSLDFGAEVAAAAGGPLDDEVVVVAVAEAAEDATAAARAVDL